MKLILHPQLNEKINGHSFRIKLKRTIIDFIQKLLSRLEVIITKL